MNVEIKLLNSLEKVFLDEALNVDEYNCGSALRGERFSFQVSCHLNEARSIRIKAHVESPLSENIEIYEVGHVPVTLPTFSGHDENYLRIAPGLYPDALYEHKGDMKLVENQWHSLLISVVVPDDAPAGNTDIKLKIESTEANSQTLAEATFTLDIIPARLPENKLIHTEWFHCDCLATYYNVPVFSEEHWEIIDNFLSNFTCFGANMILTPVLTPPLDTQVGGERPTVQLVDIIKNGDDYSFKFDKLTRYMDLAEKHGIKYFEISHLFSQWGAKKAPKVIALVNGEQRKIFGWETDSSSAEYVDFLNQFIKALRSFLTERDCLERSYFHISDEPNINMLESYRKAAESVKDALEGCHIIDALSDYDFYEHGIIKKPIPANSSIEAFIENGVENLWTYYCCSQYNEVSNRFMAMPSYRNRILGWQLYKYNIEGFLHWGYNFWYSQYSRKQINPYIETGADLAFPAGDSFLVYPGEDRKPISSLRQFVLFEGLQDLMALQLLETILSHDEVVSLFDRDDKITFKEYPHSAHWILSNRHKINQLIAEKI